MLNVTLRRPVPLEQLLAEAPAVAEVTKEPYPVNKGPQKIGLQRTLPKRFRLVLKAWSEYQISAEK